MDDICRFFCLRRRLGRVFGGRIEGRILFFFWIWLVLIWWIIWFLIDCSFLVRKFVIICNVVFIFGVFIVLFKGFWVLVLIVRLVFRRFGKVCCFLFLLKEVDEDGDIRLEFSIFLLLNIIGEGVVDLLVIVL